MEDHIITVTMEGGVIYGVHGIPPGCRLVIRDFDVDSVDMELYAAEGRLFKDGEDLFIKSEWPHLPGIDLNPLTSEPVLVTVEEVEEMFK